MADKNVAQRGGNIDNTIIGNFKVEEQPKVYRPKTSDIERALQERLNIMISSVRDAEAKKEADAKAKGENYKARHYEDIQIQVKSFEYSAKFVPLALILPEEALVSSNTTRNEMSIFHQADGETGVGTLIEPVSACFTPFFYTKKDKKGLMSPQWRAECKLSVKNADKVRYMVTPKVKKISGKRYVIVILESIKVFSWLVRNKAGDDCDRKTGEPLYWTDISDIKRINNGEYQYRITKTMKGRDKKRKNGGSDFDKQLNQILGGH